MKTKRVESVEPFIESHSPGDFLFLDESGAPTTSPESAVRILIDIDGIVSLPVHRSPDAKPPDTVSWLWDSNIEAPTLQPSIFINPPSGWHGYLTKGELNQIGEPGFVSPSPVAIQLPGSKVINDGSPEWNEYFRRAQRGFVALAFAVALILVSGCSSTVDPPKSPPAAAVTRPMVLQPPPTFHLLIGYDYTNAELVLRLYSTTNLALPVKRWRFVSVLPTGNSSWPVWATNGREFYTVSASNAAVGL